MTTKSIEPHYDSLMDILFAQCRDLEELLALARRETVAAEERDFDRILEIVTERATLGERLETYHLQIAELRKRLKESVDPVPDNPVVARTTALVTAIRTQDELTRPALVAARDEALRKSLSIERAKRNIGAYSGISTHPAVACDDHF